VRDVETDGTPKAINFNEFNNTLTDWQASGGSVFYVNGVATIGDPTLPGAGAFSTTESEVHAVFRWGSGEVNAVLQQTDGWILLKQMMYDFHSAGLIVSAAANTVDPFHGVTAAEFLQYVVELHENQSLTRPVPFIPPSGLLQTATITCDAGGGNPTISDLGGDLEIMNGGFPGLTSGSALTWSYGNHILNYPELVNPAGVDPNFEANNTTDAQTFVNKYELNITKTVAGFPGEDETVNQISVLAGAAQTKYVRFDYHASINGVGAVSSNGATTWVVKVYATGDAPA
jgi:hypothetical protein